MEQIRITQCPKCDTTFRITPSQLKVAKGAVRCGACLHVFRASDHFQKVSEPTATVQDDRTHDLFKQAPAKQNQVTDNKPAPPPKKSSDKKPVDALVHDPILDDLFATSDDTLAQAHDELVINQEMVADSELIHDDAETFTQDMHASSNEPNEPTVNRMDHNPLIDDEDPDLIDDEYALIDDDNGLIDDNQGLIDDSGYLEEQTKAPEFNEDFLSLNDKNYEDPFFSDGEKLHDTIEKDDDSDEAWAQALLDESDEPEKPQVNTPKKGAPIQQPLAATLNTIKPSFSYIEVDPLDLSLPQKTKKRQMLIWLTASLLLAVLLAAQSAYFNFNQWARQDNLRPFYLVACQHLQCTLPSSYDLASIRTTASPQVSSHTRFKDALVVDVLFINGAQYPQAFPQLSLTFSDKNEKVVAHRVFHAHEYLAGEAAGLTMMPVQTPIHIALEIADPGPSANNYQVRFLQP